MNGRALVVRLRSSERSECEVCLWAVLVALNPGAFRPGDEARLRAGEVLRRLGLLVERTSDETCTHCGVPIGRGATRCHACEHRNEGPGYSAGSRSP